MGFVDGSEPIEVELTPTELRADHDRRWRRVPLGDRTATAPPPSPPEPGAPPADTAPDDQPPAGSRTERSRLLITAGLVGVLALALGWVLGRAGADDGLATEPVPGTTASPTTLALPFPTLPIDGDEIGEPDFEEPAEDVTDEGSSAPSDTTIGPTTVEVIGPTTEPVEVDSRLLGTPVRLVGVELGGVLVEADLAIGTLTDFQVGRIASDGSGLTVGPDWVLSGSATPTRVVWSDGSETRADIGEPWRPLHVPGTDLFWRVPPAAPMEGDGMVLGLVTIEGEPIGPEIELPLNTWPFLVDPASGGVVIGNFGRSYSMTPDGPEYLGIGELIGISDTSVVTYDCDEQLACSLYRTDRATREITAVPPDPDLDEPYRWTSPAGWGPGAPSGISPDGRWIAVIGQSWRSTAIGIIELDTGRFVELARDSYPPNVVWSPDSRYAFALVDQVPTAYDTATGDRFAVFADGTRWIDIGSRPAPSAPAEEAVEG